MATEILLPKLGLTMEEGTILEWVVGAGDDVHLGDVIMRLATDKVDVDVEAEAEGRFQPAVDVGATLPPGALVAWLLEAGEDPPAAPSSSPGHDAATAAAPSGAAAPAPPAPRSADDERRRVSPNARRVAGDLGIDIASVTGTGPQGRVVSEDVEEAAERAAQAPLSAPAPAPSVGSPLVRREAERLGVDVSAITGTGLGGRIRRTDLEQALPASAAASTGPRAGDVLPLTGMRGAIARSMHASLQEMAQLTHGYEAEVSALIALRAQLKAEWGDRRVPSINDFVVRAAALALGRHPLLNATVRADGIHLLPEVHVGVAVAVEGGLVVPVVRDADRRTLVDLSEQTRDLAGRARTGKLGLSDLEGATFVVTSLGSYGVDFFTPVVNTGNVAILGVGRLRDGVAWEGDVPRRTQVLTLSLSFDHRAVDGAPAAEYLRTVTDLLARPLLLLAG